MHREFKVKIALAVAAGAALGAAAVQGLHAQTKPKAYLVSESEVLDASALASYTASITAVQKAAGGRSFGTRGKILQASATHLNVWVSASGIAWSKCRPTSTRQNARNLCKMGRSSK